MKTILIYLALFGASSAQYITHYREFRDRDMIRNAYGVPLDHVGVQVLTSDNQRYMIHNNGYGTLLQNFLTYPHHEIIYDDWKDSRNVTLGQAQRVGGSEYRLFTNNCYHARNRITSYLSG